MNCRLTARQCISATVGNDYGPPGGKPDASFIHDRPFRRTYCDTGLSAHAVCDRRIALPAPANLLGLHGRGDRPAWALGGGRNGHCPVLPLPPLGHRRVRSRAEGIAERCAVVAPLDLCGAGSREIGRIGLSQQTRVQEGQRHGTGIRDIEALDRPRHVEAHQEIAVFPAESPQPVAFAAEHERDRAPQGRLCQI